jgi:superfamily II DNA or RNA helicase
MSEITNEQGNKLTDVINNIMPSAQNLYFLVGYFYFSGFQEIYKNLDDKKLKILVGMDIQKDLNNRIVEIESYKSSEQSNHKIRFDYYKQLRTIFNESDLFDSSEKQKAFKIFVSKIQDGSLEIRRTKEPNHSKFYIFENKSDHNQGGEFPGTVIFGSSNLSYSGFAGRRERNETFREKVKYESYKRDFDDEWEESTPLVSKDSFEEFKEEVMDKIWIDKTPSPYAVYLRVLKEYFSIEAHEGIKLPHEITKERFSNLKYQIDAIQQSINILSRHNGVIIADVVGLGKSIIASTIAHNLKLDAVVIAPPHLVKQWDDYRYEFNFNARVYSSGMIEQALNESEGDSEKLIIVDEAHKYRNEETADYALLHRLCQGNKVMLLTATPFNNDPKDIFSMIKLFQIPAKSTIQTIDSLSIRFKSLIKEYKEIKKFQRDGSLAGEDLRDRINNLAAQIRDLLSPLIIRRSRLDLAAIKTYKEDLDQQGIAFPEVKPPVCLEYDLGQLGSIYKKTLETIAPNSSDSGFIGARYKPTSYLVSDKEAERLAKELNTDVNLLRNTQTNIAEFMKRLLVRRFESSIYAFNKTLKNMIDSSESILKWYERGKVPIYKKGNLPDVESLFDDTGDDSISQLDDINYEEQLQGFIDKGLEFVNSKDLSPKFEQDLRNDIKLLNEIRGEWTRVEPIDDPKINHFIEIIKSQLATNDDRKIVVFTEYSDTADYLFSQLKDRFKAFKYSASDASKKNSELIRENFDAGYQMQKNDYDLLIATDAISEGYNLHRAGTVFNYDIPYNPTRVIQRVGRINRINKKVFDQLFIYNFFPTVTGEIETRVKQISTLKIAVIQALLGEDTMVLTSDEELQSFYSKEFLDEMEKENELSWDAKYRNLLDSISSSNSEAIHESTDLPKRTRIRRSNNANMGVIVFGRKGNDYSFKFGTNKAGVNSITTPEAIRLFESNEQEKAQEVSEKFEDIYENVKNNLFSRKKEVAKDPGLVKAIEKIDELITIMPEKKEYFEDLKFVVKELDAVPQRVTKEIRAISKETLKEDIDSLIQNVPHNYLIEIRETAENIDEGEESLILAEELE